ncbi:phospholipase A2 [Tersicoccus sp. Bi-70]|uniref:phospholipase A2 n=1 Tax=Tersicoccus sp. Bi-70 TaxID=1897634 RepID=UPI0009767DB2|nr:phospholipase A2 [Tersicoccus sp. Bi-70]
MRTTILRVLGTLAVLAVLLGMTATSAQAAPGRQATAATQVTALATTTAATTDYCGTRSTAWVPDSWGKADFRYACARHDACYSATSTTSRLACDQAFLTRLRTACSTAYSAWNPLRYTCYGVAWTYYEAVREFGVYAYSGKGSRA